MSERGWVIWDNDTMNMVGWYATEAEARAALTDLIAANPGWGDDLQVFEDPT